MSSVSSFGFHVIGCNLLVQSEIGSCRNRVIASTASESCRATSAASASQASSTNAGKRGCGKESYHCCYLFKRPSGFQRMVRSLSLARYQRCLLGIDPQPPRPEIDTWALDLASIAQSHRDCLIATLRPPTEWSALRMVGIHWHWHGEVHPSPQQRPLPFPSQSHWRVMRVPVSGFGLVALILRPECTICDLASGNP